MSSWVEGATGSGFDLDHLPYGVFSRAGEAPRVGVRIGDQVLDLAPVAEIGDPASLLAATWRTPSLNAFLALGREQWDLARWWVGEVLGEEVHAARTRPHLRRPDHGTGGRRADGGHGWDGFGSSQGGERGALLAVCAGGGGFEPSAPDAAQPDACA